MTMARRGWLEKKDVINTLPTEQFLAALRPKPGAARQKSATPKKAAAKTLDESSSCPAHGEPLAIVVGSIRRSGTSASIGSN